MSESCPVKVETTFVLFKPDAVMRKITGELTSMIESIPGLVITMTSRQTPTIGMAKEHYVDHEGKSYFNDLVKFLASGDIIALEVCGYNAVSLVREVMGSYKDPAEGTIRAKFATSQMYNVIHASDSVEAAKRESMIWFAPLSRKLKDVYKDYHN